MDLAFLRRAERLLANRQPSRLDFSILVATLAAQRPAEDPQPKPCAPDPDDDPLVELLLAGPGWREALSAQQGCFSRAEAGRRVNVP